MDIGQYVKITCWISITLILWTLISGLIQSSLVVWFAFAFFCFVGIVSYSVSR